MEILTNKIFFQLVESSIISANPKLKKIYNKSFGNILDIIEEEVDFEDINETMKKLAQTSENNYLNEIKEQIIFNAK